MNAYPSELRTPPLPLIAFLGCPDLHKDVGAYFSQVLRPPMVSVGVAEANESLLARLFGARKAEPKSTMPDGILKADWFLKQRQKKAAVAVAFVERSDLEGDPSAWNRVLTQLRSVRNATVQRNAGMILVVLQTAAEAAPLSADRTAAVKQNLGLEDRHIFLLARDLFTLGAPPEARKARLDAELKPLGKLVLDTACTYYANESQRIRQRHADATAAGGAAKTPELNVQVAFKLAVMAEFRQDWITAVHQYQAAYGSLKEVPLGSPVSYQRHAEVCRVAEQVHFKIVMLLLHQQRVEEALEQYREHMATFATTPAGFPPAAAAAHLGWVCRQYQTAAEMIRSRVDDATLAAGAYKDCQPDYLQLAAAQLALKRRAAAEAARQDRAAHPLSFDVSNIKKGLYVGQMVLKTEQGSKDLTDAEYLLFLEAEESKLPHGQLTLELMNAAVLALKDHKHERIRSHLGALMAREHIAANNLIAARKLLLQVAHTYRREGWERPLLQVLVQLRDCAQRLKLPREFVCYSLEISALPNDIQESLVQHMARSAIATLVTGTSDIKASIMKPSSSSSAGRPSATLLPSDPAATAAASASPDATAAGAAFSPRKSSVASSSSSFEYMVEHLELRDARREAKERDDGSASTSRPSLADVLVKHNQQDYGWWRCLAVAAGFRQSVPDPSFVDFAIAIRSALPVPLPVQALLVQFTDEQGSWQEAASQGVPPPLPPHLQRSSSSSLSTLTQPTSPGFAPVPTAASLNPFSNGDTPRQSYPNPHSASSTADAYEAAWPRSPPAENTSLLCSTSGRPPPWQHFHVRLRPRAAGSLRAAQLTLQVSPHASVTWQLASFPPQRPVLGFETHPLATEAPPFRAADGVQAGTLTCSVLHLGPMPTVTLQPPDTSLVGEYACVRCVVAVSTPTRGAVLELALRATAGADSVIRAQPAMAFAAPTTPADISLLMQAPGSSPQLLTTEGHQVNLPDMLPGSSLPLSLWVRCSEAGSVGVSARLLRPAPVVASCELTFAKPFMHRTRLWSETGCHTLTLPSRGSVGHGGDDGALPLVIGQSVMLMVSVRATQAAQLELLDAHLESVQDTGLQFVSNLQQQLQTCPVRLSRGAIQSLLLQFCPIKEVSDSFSMGRLLLKWRRADSGSRRAGDPAGAALADSVDALGSKAAALGLADGDATAGASQLQPGPSPEVVTALDLPLVSVQDSILTVRSSAPAQATAGIAFAYNLHVHNNDKLPLEVTVSLQDAPGFVYSGDAQQTLTVLPGGNSTTVWLLVAHSSGTLALPAARISANRYNCAVVTQSTHIHIVPF